MPVWASVLITGGLLGAALAFRAREYGAYLAIAGLALLTAQTYDGKMRNAGIHATRAEYERVMNNRQTVEEDRKGEPVLFWYQREDSNFHEYFALNASYMAEFARIGEQFPKVAAPPWNAVTS